MEWAAEKRLNLTPIYKGFNTELETELLSQIAYISFEENRLFFSKDEIIAYISTFLKDTLNAPKHLDGLAVLKAIEVQQGILIERATNIYSFSHLTLQEYLTAKYIVDNHLISESVRKHFTKNNWQDIFLLIAGLERSAETLLLEIQKQSLTFIKTRKLQNLIRKIDRVARSMQEESKQSIKRVLLTISVLIHTLARDIASAKARNSDYNYNLAQVRALNFAISLATEQDFNLNYTLNYANKLNDDKLGLNNVLILIKGLELDLDCTNEHRLVLDLNYATSLVLANTHNLELEEINSLTDYLAITLTLLKCKKSAIKLSSKAWSNIEREILSIPESTP